MVSAASPQIYTKEVESLRAHDEDDSARLDGQNDVSDLSLESESTREVVRFRECTAIRTAPRRRI